jgi:hypothetical protein
MEFTQWCEWIEDLLATLATLRVFGIDFHYTGWYEHAEVYLPFITQVSHRAPQLEYFTIYYGKNLYGKLVRGVWVLCDEERFPYLLEN